MRTDVVFASEQFKLSERRTCKLIALDRSSYRYEPRPDHNAALRQELLRLARQKPRWLPAIARVGHQAWISGECATRVSTVSSRESDAAAVKKKPLARVAVASHLVRSNQEWALDFVSDALATGRGIRILTVVDAFTRENLSLEVDVSYRAGG